MKTEIKRISLGEMRQAEDFTFHTLAFASMDTCTDQQFTAAKADYKAKLEAFDRELKKSGGTDPDTKIIAEADAATDACYVGLATYARAMRLHFDPLTAEIARRACIIIERYGNPTGLSYLEEYGVIDNLIQDLRDFDTAEVTLPAPDGTDTGEGEDRPGALAMPVAQETHNLATLGLEPWIGQLKKCRDNFMTLFTAQNTRKGQTEAGTTKVARQATDTAYRAAVKRLNALIELNGPDAYAGIIGDINALIDRQKAVTANRATRNAKKKEEKPTTPPDDRPGEL